ncbi:glycosyltransferase [Ruminococcus flavefaciens]|uniref:glycosyltransferase n=1 Tax=Ruminococcus flavefaciens TaxID=1265 RepID=UPI0026F26999|nr:glycosyltransferase [Ruminococcus flavefaciens]MDD7516839.1 glycosyltransferase [Ruminococcus flavefaciens]MDY5692987.1 glycosyltransferase [Ruminococcus flavefaciens]
MKKVLIVVKNLPVGGISNVIFSYYSAMQTVAKNEIKMDFAAGNPIDSRYKAMIKKGGSRLYLTNKDKNPLAYVLRIASIVRKSGYKTVHVHGNSAMLIPDLLGARLGGAKCIISHAHSTMCNHPKLNNLIKPLFHLLYTHSLACSKAAGKWMFGNRPFIVMKNGLVTEDYRFNKQIREKTRASLNIGDRYVIGHIGHFNYSKNHEALIDIFMKYHRQFPDSMLLLIGDGEDKPHIIKKVSEYGLENDVIFYGVSTNVSQLLMAMDCLVLPSRFEGLPCTLVEAQAAGLPCIASTNVPREAKMSENFDFINTADHKGWIKSLEKMRSASDRTEASRKNIISLTKEGYDIYNAAEVLKDIYLYPKKYKPKKSR